MSSNNIQAIIPIIQPELDLLRISTDKIIQRVRKRLGIASKEKTEFIFEQKITKDLALTGSDLLHLPQELNRIGLILSTKVLLSYEELERYNELAEDLTKLVSLGYIRHFKIGNRDFYTTLSIPEVLTLEKLTPHERKTLMAVIKGSKASMAEIKENLKRLGFEPLTKENLTSIIMTLKRKGFVQQGNAGSFFYYTLNTV